MLCPQNLPKRRSEFLICVSLPCGNTSHADGLCRRYLCAGGFFAPPPHSPLFKIHPQDSRGNIYIILPATDPWFVLLDYRKGVSFLSRIIGTKKKDQPSEAEDETSESEAHRMSVDTSHPIGFIPRHPAPSKYLKVRAHYKKDKTFNRVFLAQELQGSGPSPKLADRRISMSSASPQNGDHTGKAVWALMFSKDGKYLAAAGQDRKVRVWTVIATPEEREDANGDEEATPVDAQDTSGLKAPVFQPVPVQVYEGHTGSILDLSWSKVCILKTSNSTGNGHADLRARTTSFSHHQWTRQCDYGMSLDRNVFAVSSTVIL